MSSGKPDKVRCDESMCAFWTKDWMSGETGEYACAIKVIADCQVSLNFEAKNKG
jgi:hypothetical protein